MIKQPQCQVKDQCWPETCGSFQQRIQYFLDRVGLCKFIVKHHIPIQSDNDKPGQIGNLEIFDDLGIPSDQHGIGKAVPFGVRLHFSFLIDRIDGKNLDIAIGVIFIDLE
jgi:hypothetical protein